MIFRRRLPGRPKREEIVQRRQAVHTIDEAMRRAKKEQDRAFAEEIERWKDRVGA
jgi:hypothetical protein